VKEQKLFLDIDKERDTLIADTEKLSSHIENLLTKLEGTAIVDGHYAPEVVPSDFADKVFVLRRNPKELRNVLEMRGYSEKKIWENLGAEILDVCLQDALSAYSPEAVCEIDVTGKTIEAVADEIVKILAGKTECRKGIVDWMRKLQHEGLLDEYLRKI